MTVDAGGIVKLSELIKELAEMIDVGDHEVELQVGDQFLEIKSVDYKTGKYYGQKVIIIEGES